MRGRIHRRGGKREGSCDIKKVENSAVTMIEVCRRTNCWEEREHGGGRSNRKMVSGERHGGWGEEHITQYYFSFFLARSE